MTLPLVHVENVQRHLFLNPYSGGIMTTDPAGAAVFLEALEGVELQTLFERTAKSCGFRCDEAAIRVQKFLSGAKKAGLLFRAAPENWERVPKTAIILATEKCGMSCEYCEFEGEDAEMDTSEFERVIDRLANAGVEHFVLGGADPLFRKDIVEILGFIRQRGASFSLATPLISLSAEVLDALKEGGDLRIRLDGAAPETADWNREKGSFERVMGNISRLRKNGIGFSIVSRIFKKNIQDIGNLCDLAARLGSSWIGFEGIRRYWSGKDLLSLLPGPEEMEKALSYINYKSLTLDSTIVVCKDIDILKRGRQEDPTRIRTDVGKRFIAVDASGFVIPHPALRGREAHLGSALEDDIADIWVRNPLLRKFRETPVDDLEKCKGCEFKYLCGGGPREEALYGGNSFLSGWGGCARMRYYLRNKLNLILFHDFTNSLMH